MSAARNGRAVETRRRPRRVRSGVDLRQAALMVYDRLACGGSGQPTTSRSPPKSAMISMRPPSAAMYAARVRSSLASTFARWMAETRFLDARVGPVRSCLATLILYTGPNFGRRM